MPLLICNWTPIGKSKKIMCALGITCLAVSFTAGGQPIDAPPLTLQAALDAAQARSQSLTAQDAAAAAAHEQAVAAGRLPDPMLRLSVDSLPINGPMQYSLTQDFMTTRTIGFTQTLPREEKRHARTAYFEREADAALASRSMRLANLRRSTALAWFDRYYQQQMVDLLTHQRAQTAAQVESVDAAFRAGRGEQADVVMVRAGVARLDDRLRDAQARLGNATTTLRRWVGEPANAPLAPAPNLSITRLASHTVEQQLDQYPDVALMRAKEGLAQAQVELARQDQHADWSASLMFGQRGPAFSNMVSFGVAIPLQWDQKNRQDRELAAKLFKVEQARDEREEVARDQLAQTQRWLDTWRSDLDRIRDYDTTLLPLAADRSTAALTAYRGGKSSLSKVIEARRMEIDTRIERLRIEMDAAALWAELEYLMPETQP
jgi:cobalt-zinc-cadmium efflux system outer membrane protein